MATTLEEVFKQELRNSIKVTEIRDIYKVQLPANTLKLKASGCEMYAVKDLTNSFSPLNNRVVRQVPKGATYKRRVINKATRGFKRNEDGSYVLEEVKVPSGSMMVTSITDIGLPYIDYIKPPEGFGYVDFQDLPEGRRYVYILPKKYLYKVHQTALALSTKSMKCYSGYKYTTWNMGSVYLSVIPYNPRTNYVETKILCTGFNKLNYSQEIKEISDYWESINFIPNIALCSLTTGENLCVSHCAVGYNDYIPVEQIPIGSNEVL